MRRKGHRRLHTDVLGFRFCVTRRHREVATRKRVAPIEMDRSQVIDSVRDLKIFGEFGWGGSRIARKGYTLDVDLQLVTRRIQAYV